MEPLKLISVNVERSKHLDRVLPFLEKGNADVVCVQELMERDIPGFERVTGRCISFVPATRHQAEGNPGVMGIGMFSRHEAGEPARAYYHGGEEIRDFDITSPAAKYESESLAVLSCDIQKDGMQFRIAMTHFTWTPDGEPDEFQRRDLRKLLEILGGMGEFVLCGDFNAPRGGEIFSKIAEKYKDNIPPEYVTSLDLELHRATARGKRDEIANKMVDGLFTTPGYAASDVQLVSGVSDHCAIVARIAKTA